MAGKRTVTVSRVIPAPSEQIWRVLDDTSRYAEWVPQTLEVTRNDGEAVVGATYDERNRVVGPITGSSRWRVVERDPGRYSLHEGEGLPLVAQRLDRDAHGAGGRVHRGHHDAPLRHHARPGRRADRQGGTRPDEGRPGEGRSRTWSGSS